MEASTAAKFKEQDFRFWQSMIAGSVAGYAKYMTTFSVHASRERLMLLRSYSQKPVGSRQAFRSVIQAEGPSLLSRGMSFMRLEGIGLYYAVYFSSFEVSKNLLSTGNLNDSLAHAISGVFAAVSSCAISGPVDMVRRRLIYGKGRYQGVWDCVKRVTCEEGISAFYASYRRTILRNAYYSGIHFATYETAKRRLTEISQERQGWLVHAAAGATAGGLATALTWPLVVIEMNPAQPTNPSKCDFKVSFSYVLRSIVKYEGLRGLFRGGLRNMLLHAPATAMCWSTYEAAKSSLQDLSDG